MKLAKVVALDENSNAYCVSLKGGEVVEERLAQEVLEERLGLKYGQLLDRNS